jgi:hypothetical protein
MNNDLLSGYRPLEDDEIVSDDDMVLILVPADTVIQDIASDNESCSQTAGEIKLNSGYQLYRRINKEKL